LGGEDTRVEHSRQTMFSDAVMPASASSSVREPVAECGVVLVDAQRDIDGMGVVPVPLRDWIFEPLVVPLGREPQHPARHRDRHPDAGVGRGHLTDEREDYFPGRFAWDK